MVHQWEYYVQTLFDYDVSQEWLNMMGESGWEISAWGQTKIILQRPMSGFEATWVTQVRNFCRQEKIAPTTLITAYEELKNQENDNRADTSASY